MSYAPIRITPEAAQSALRRHQGVHCPQGTGLRPQSDQNPATPDYFIFSDGGNTRYAILRELWEETRDERFYRLTCYVKPWPGRLMCLLGHLAENDLQGKLSFIDRAKGIADARVLYEQESDQRLSLRTFSTLLDRDGYRLDSSEIQRMEYSLQYLYPVFPGCLTTEWDDLRPVALFVSTAHWWIRPTVTRPLLIKTSSSPFLTPRPHSLTTRISGHLKLLKMRCSVRW